MTNTNKKMVKFKKKDSFVSAFGWGDMHNNYSSADYEAVRNNDRKFSKKAMIVSTKEEAWMTLATKLDMPVYLVRKQYELRYRKAPYLGKKTVGEWVPCQDFCTYKAW